MIYFSKLTINNQKGQTRLKPLFLVILLSFYSLSSNADYEKNTIALQAIITAVKNNDKVGLSKYIHYPLKRLYPLPSIDTPEEFIERYSEIFDKNLIEAIANSDIEKDWLLSGWRGIMLKGGMVWVNYDGLIVAINYRSSAEEIKRNKLINKEKAKIHSSLKDFEYPILEWKTKNYRIRIDAIEGSKYRYASWAARKNTNTKPDLIINDGHKVFKGSGGNHHYEFKNGEYIYKCSVIKLGTSYSPPGRLEVYKKNELVLSEDVIEVNTN